MLKWAYPSLRGIWTYMHLQVCSKDVEFVIKNLRLLASLLFYENKILFISTFHIGIIHAI